MRKCQFILLAALVGGLAGCGGGAPPDLSSTLIAFYSDRDANREIYAMNSNGTNQTRLTNNPAWDWYPSWSPDGTKIAFLRQDVFPGPAEIFLMNADGGNEMNLTNNPGAEWFGSWSPDGGRIAISSDRDGEIGIYVMKADGTDATHLATGRSPLFSPDGSKIAFVSTGDSGYSEIFVINSDGTSQTQLTSNVGGNESPVWRPDGTKIAFVSYRNNTIEIYVVNPDGTNQVQLTNNQAQEAIPTWSPDGGKIAFQSYLWNWHIHVINSDGTNETNLTIDSPGKEDNNPSWSPDGQKIAFESTRDHPYGSTEIYVMNSDGARQTRLTVNEVFDGSPTWSPLPTTGIVLP